MQVVQDLSLHSGFFLIRVYLVMLICLVCMTLNSYYVVIWYLMSNLYYTSDKSTWSVLSTVLHCCSPYYNSSEDIPGAIEFDCGLPEIQDSLLY